MNKIFNKALAIIFVVSPFCVQAQQISEDSYMNSWIQLRKAFESCMM